MNDPLVVVSSGFESTLRDTSRCKRRHVVNRLEELRPILEGVESPLGDSSLDLLGHSVRDGQLLRLGRTVIDLLDPKIEQFFREIADRDLLNRIGVRAVRLLGCSTAVHPTGQRTIRRLARILRVPVFGTTKFLFKSHYTEEGFNPAFSRVLVESAQLSARPCVSRVIQE